MKFASMQRVINLPFSKPVPFNVPPCLHLSPPNGSRLSRGANAGGRKHPALRYPHAGAQTYACSEAGSGTFKRLLGGRSS